MSNKRKKNKSVRTISKSQKALYNAGFGVLIAIFIVLALWISDIYKLLHKPMGYLYVEPTAAAYISFYILIGMGLILTVYFYGSLIDRKKALKQIRQKAKMILPIYLVLAIVISAFCFPSYYSIDDTASYSKNTLFGSEEIFTKDDIKCIDIYVLGSPIGASTARMVMEYSIACTLSVESGKYTINSDCFYSYRDMYDYLSGLNATVEADRYKLDDLIEYQRRPANFSAENVNENIEYINKIFDLENA